MIILGNPDFATGMRLAGISDSHVVRSREEALSLVAGLDKSSFIIANVSVINLAPELEEFRNLVSIPDDAGAFDSTEDLRSIIISAVGMNLNI